MGAGLAADADPRGWSGQVVKGLQRESVHRGIEVTIGVPMMGPVPVPPPEVPPVPPPPVLPPLAAPSMFMEFAFGSFGHPATAMASAQTDTVREACRKKQRRLVVMILRPFIYHQSVAASETASASAFATHS